MKKVSKNKPFITEMTEYGLEISGSRMTSLEISESGMYQSKNVSAKSSI